MIVFLLIEIPPSKNELSCSFVGRFFFPEFIPGDKKGMAERTFPGGFFRVIEGFFFAVNLMAIIADLNHAKGYSRYNHACQVKSSPGEKNIFVLGENCGF